MTPRYPRLRSHRNRERWVVRHLPLVRRIATRMSPRVPQLEIDDLVAAGTIGLIEAVDRYDEELGVPFRSFAYRRIKGAIIDEIRRFLGRETTASGQRAAAPLSLEAPIFEMHDLTLLDVTPDRLAPQPETGVELNELLRAIDDLPCRQREILRLSASGHTVTEIAFLHGCSPSRASQLLVEARYRLEERIPA